MFNILVDYRFIIKTIPSNEAELLMNILSSYYYYIGQYPHTLLSRFYGFYAIKSKETSSQLMHFVIMENVFTPKYEIHRCYDLKGSTRGRFAKESEKIAGNAILKDLDIDKGTIKLQDKVKRQLAEQIHQDCWFLETNNIMDYSLLVGIHERDHVQPIPVSKNTPFFRKDDGGLVSGDGEELYFLGVIDILTPYGWRKILENSFKTMYNEEHRISAVHPRLYRERFEHFLFTHCID